VIRNGLSCRTSLDPGSLGAEDQLRNVRAVREGTRVFSAYELPEAPASGSAVVSENSSCAIVLRF